MGEPQNESPPQQEDRPRIATILDGALAILLEGGDTGLTMRQVARRAGISLGHLQHYFPTKNDLLKGLVSCHFERCLTALRQYTASADGEDAHQLVRGLVDFGLAYVGGGPSDTCRIFREFWALSPRNAEVRDHLDGYYREYANLLAELLLPVAEGRDAAQRAVALLLPWFEGYSVTAASIDVSEEDLAQQWTDLLVGILGEAPSRKQSG